jgi:hypothetical protein
LLGTQLFKITSPEVDDRSGLELEPGLYHHRPADVVGGRLMFTEDDADSDGPRVMVTLPDEQQLLATVRRRRHVPGSGPRWWYLLELPLWSAVRGPDGAPRPGRWSSGPRPTSATSLEGEDHGDVRTDHARARTPAFLIEEVAGTGPNGSEGLVVHCGHCAATTGIVHSAAPEVGSRGGRPGAPSRLF